MEGREISPPIQRKGKIMISKTNKNHKILYILTLLLICTTGFAFPCWNQIQPEAKSNCTPCKVTCQTITEPVMQNCAVYHPHKFEKNDFIKFKSIPK